MATKLLEEALTVQISEMLIKYGIGTETIYLGTATVSAVHVYTLRSTFPIELRANSLDTVGMSLLPRFTSIITQNNELYTRGQMAAGGIVGRVVYRPEPLYQHPFPPPLSGVFVHDNDSISPFIQRIHALHYDSQFAQTPSLKSIIEATEVPLY